MPQLRDRYDHRSARAHSNSEQRLHQRWKPPAETWALVTSSAGAWAGDVLDIGHGGCLIEGLPTKISLGVMVDIDIVLPTYDIHRQGCLARVVKGPGRSHALTFVDYKMESAAPTCVSCRTGVAMVTNETLALGRGLFCPDCTERSKERIGVDFDYDELGWG